MRSLLMRYLKIKTKYGTKIKTSEYCEMGAHLIIDQGQEQVAGYTDIEEGGI